MDVGQEFDGDRDGLIYTRTVACDFKIKSVHAGGPCVAVLSGAFELPRQQAA